MITRSVLVLKLPEKNALFPLLGIYLLLRNQVYAENIGIKVFALITPSKPLFTATVLPAL